MIGRSLNTEDSRQAAREARELGDRLHRARGEVHRAQLPAPGMQHRRSWCQRGERGGSSPPVALFTVHPRGSSVRPSAVT